MRTQHRAVLSDEGIGVITAETHWLEWDAEKFPHQRARGLCGYIVDESSFSTQPTCLECQRKQREIEEWEI